jgi:hypothetical protein
MTHPASHLSKCLDSVSKGILVKETFTLINFYFGSFSVFGIVASVLSIVSLSCSELIKYNDVRNEQKCDRMFRANPSDNDTRRIQQDINSSKTIIQSENLSIEMNMRDADCVINYIFGETLLVQS